MAFSNYVDKILPSIDHILLTFVKEFLYRSKEESAYH